MRKTTGRLVAATLVAGALLSTGVGSASATPANPGKGTGCYVGDANGAYYLDAACSRHDVLKLNDDGSVAFYSYQDAGQLPAGAALPSSAIHNTFEQCYNFGALGIICGTVTETITPSGAYKSSFRAH